MADSDVDLTALAVIRRYSLAVRQPSAGRDELLEALRADVAWLESGARARPAARAATTPTTKATPAKASPAGATTAAPAPARKASPTRARKTPAR